MSGLSDFLTHGSAPWWTSLAGVVVGSGISFVGVRGGIKANERLALAKAAHDDRQRWDTVIMPAVTSYLESLTVQVEAVEAMAKRAKALYGEPPYGPSLVWHAIKQGHWRALSAPHVIKFNRTAKRLVTKASKEDLTTASIIAQVQMVAPKAVREAAVEALSAANSYCEHLLDPPSSPLDIQKLHDTYQTRRRELQDAARFAFQVDGEGSQT